MAGGSISDPCIIDDDDPYFPPLTNPYIIVDDYSIPDEKYAEQLQLHEALVFSSASRASTSSSPKTPIVILDNQDSRALTSSSPNTPIVILDGQDSQAYESSQVADRFCDICMDTKTESEMFRNTKVCGHMFCFDCIRGHVAAKIQENITKVRCPDPHCRGIIGPEVCRLIVPKEVLERWEDALCESLILGAEKFYCPFKDCSALLVDDGGGTVTSSECPHCNRLFCAQCKVTWHSGISCSEYQSLKKDERDPSDLMLRDLAKNKAWKRCPKCNFYVERTTGCEHIACRCGYQFCYMCGNMWNGEGSTSSMDDSSISHPYIIVDIDDDPYFPPLVSRDPISNQKYAEQLQLHEALVFSSASRASSSKTPIVILDGQDLKPYESSQVADRFSDICMDTKTESEMFRNSKVCGHMCPDPNCKGVIGPEACRLIVPKEVLERWENALCESLVLGTPKFYCPFKDCSALLHYKKKENGLTSALVDSRLLDTCNDATRWNRLLPIKVNVLKLNKLPSRVNLDRRGIDVILINCPSCQGDLETVNHTFFNCGLAKELWSLLA
ncbi:zinc finger, C6HC-type containing protein [Tanacetum coccineum]